VVWSQNHSDGFYRFGLKTCCDGFCRFGLKTCCDGLALKPAATVSDSLASKPAVTVFQFGRQNRQLWFDDLGLKITAAVSWFVPQNQVSFDLSIAP
jgi:hypothetical protein